MLNPKEEAQSIKRVETIKLQDIKSFKTCDELIDICLEIIEKIDINISDFILENKIFGYNYQIDVNNSIEAIINLKNELINKRKVTNDLHCLNDYLIEFNEKNNISDLVVLAGVYFMYTGKFSKGLSLIEFSKAIGGREGKSIVTNVEVLNEFIFKYNLSIDITKLENYKEPCEILRAYYDQNIRIDRGDQLLIILYKSLNQTRKSKEVLESIYNVSNNALFHYEIAKGNSSNKSKFQIVIGIILIICASGGLLYTRGLSSKENKGDVNKKQTQVVIKQTENKNKVEDKKEIIKEPAKAVDKAVDFKTLQTMVDGISKIDSIEEVEKQIKLIRSNKELKSKSEFEKINKKFIAKKQNLYYKAGRESLKAGNVDKAINELTLSYNEKVGEYLDPHITYYLASAVNKKNPKDSLKYYKEYIYKYEKSDDSYIDEALYNLSIINWELKNQKEAKKYATQLKKKYSKSMYNNEKIQGILS